ncbi:hypothetical protein HJC23_000648 [Cyclotella cryptica]|uniref:Myb-like domain-containing protein n=1 Tax=Cyclotella cryptica TaxID=29204 RepID=A0ABD3Q736_9STRA
MASITAPSKNKEGLPHSLVEDPESIFNVSGTWAHSEHEAFKQGILKCGWSRWKEIQEGYVPTRTKSQIKSHAQKFELHHPEEANMLKNKEYTNDLMGKVHATKVHRKLKIPKKALTHQAKMVKHTPEEDLNGVCAILQKLSREQVQGILAKLNIDVPQSPLGADATTPSHLTGAQASIHYFHDQLSHPNLAARVSPTNEYEQSGDDIFGMDGLELFGEDVLLPDNVVLSQDINFHREEIKVGDHYRKICCLLNQRADFNNAKECIMMENFEKKVLSKGPLMRVRLTSLIQHHIESNWWKGDASSVTAPIRGDAKSQDIRRNQQEVEHLVALLVIMYDLEEWRVLSSPGNVFELGDIYALVHKAAEMWTRIKVSLMRGGYTLFGGENGAYRASLINSMVDSLAKFCQELEASCLLDLE